MDPQVVWDEMLCAYVAGDWPGVREHADALSAWMGRGGFAPAVIADPLVGDDFNFAMAIVGCKYALAKALKEGGQ